MVADKRDQVTEDAVLTIVVTGGGSGGHITPILAVARELKKLSPDTRIVYIGQRGDGLDDVVSESGLVDEMHAVYAGKFRRYNGEGWRQWLDLETLYLNIRDGFRTIAGFWQSVWLLNRIKPEIIFTRGSYVSVPVCLAGALFGVPYITHDSDAIPSLTNRIIARWAALHAVALPEELYQYPIDKTVTVGVPISGNYERVTDSLIKRYKQELGLSAYDKILTVTGGGLGALRLNEAVIQNAPELLKRYPKLAILHLTGRAHEGKVQMAYDKALPSEARGRVMVKGFVTDLHRHTGAATVVISRAGATFLAEMAVQGKACVIVPNPALTGGHQLKNTEALKRKGAIVEMTEDQIEQELRLTTVVADLFDHPAKAEDLARSLIRFGKPDASERIAKLLLEKGAATETPPA
jgi:UDP-N-acetylglucosamine--N-acetylmuramyl-(pentapeptide) pyrophosphoryl-undecaprenol N-acetylglucosamine transferase